MTAPKAPRKSRTIQTPGDTQSQAEQSTTQVDVKVEVDNSTNELPDADSIDQSKLTDRVLTKQGWLLPNGGADNV